VRPFLRPKADSEKPTNRSIGLQEQTNQSSRYGHLKPGMNTKGRRPASVVHVNCKARLLEGSGGKKRCGGRKRTPGINKGNSVTCPKSHVR
jgi:hypothetical protein